MDAFVGEIRAFTYSFVPLGWLACNGQSVPVVQNQQLYAVIGNTYGGNTSAFNLPNLNGAAVVGAGIGPGLSSWTLGQTDGAESVALTSSAQLPPHTHTPTLETVLPINAQANTTAAPVANSSWLSRAAQITGPTTNNPIPNFTRPVAGVDVDTTLHPVTVGTAGNGVTHENRQPYLTLVYCICTDGTWPPHP
jgi:microcystin-dependent protein